jgi:hypothetical protein
MFLLTRGLAGDVVCHSGDAVNFVDNACGNALEQVKVKVVWLNKILAPFHKG